MRQHKPFLRRLLLSRTDWMEQRLIASAERHGYGDVTAAMSRLCAHLAGKPMGLSELARRLAVSRQAVHKLASEAASLGYVEFIDSEKDGRIKLLRFTQKGWDMAESAERELLAIEAELAEQIGPERLELLKEILALPWSAQERERRDLRGSLQSANLSTNMDKSTHQAE
ncbi:MarR family winged helix-turn-helix transcriptional regulator [Malikia granosa]|uniref:MarR family transcriptional regulator n=1 Tax=Malikia granosa TaxID=263067 RepID=A0A2S9K7A4_9BURK|nr:MarR family transcriptional regulator [Malikia granosa]PRD66297.1 MarR family transcriptional regulator [Malikia granosa]